MVGEDRTRGDGALQLLSRCRGRARRMQQVLDGEHVVAAYVFGELHTYKFEQNR